MTEQAETTDEDVRRCWCCDQDFPEESLVHLGAHPEVRLCPGCARWVHRRAIASAGVGARGPAAMAQTVARRVRARVIDGGWHDRPVVGRLLRWLDRFLP